MDSIRLTVGVPTYNRGRLLRVALDSVLSQMDDRIRGQVEVLISDNASTDLTREVVNEYIARYPDVVTYHYNSHNLGYSRNVDAVICQARGTFVLILSDDDGLESNALATLWDILGQHGDLGVVFLSETPYDPELKAPLNGQLIETNRKGGQLYRPGIEYIEQTHIFPPALVSGYVVRREAWIKANPAKYYNTLIVHSLTVLRILVTQEQYSAYTSHAPCIRYRTEGKGATCAEDELFPFAFHLDHLIGCKSVRAECSAKIYRYLYQQAMRSIAYHIMDQKVTGGRINSLLLRKRLKELADKEDPLLWLNLVLMCMPAWMILIPFRIAVRIRDMMRQRARCVLLIGVW